MLNQLIGFLNLSLLKNQFTLSITEHPIVFYDGHCGLCNRAVHFIIRHDSEEHFRFATLQGKLAEKLLTESQRLDLRSVVVLNNNKAYERSAAAFEALRFIKGWPRILRVFRFLPRVITDGVYLFIAHYRYRWFGRYDECPLPEPGLRKRFLDQSAEIG